jgi:hypothetical protein
MKMKQSDRLSLSQMSYVDGKKIIKEEKEYNEKIKNNLQNSRLKLSLNNEIIGKNVNNKNYQKNEIKQNQINNDEIIEFEKKSKKKIMN